MNKYVKKEIQFAGRTLVLETGELAIQANMAVKATYGDTVLLVTVVSGEHNPDLDFFPLTVNYQEKLYAAGLIKSSRFVKRDGRPSDESTITKRMIDHAIRPLFPADYKDEVQVIVTVLSLESDADPEFVALIATSAALHASDIPWDGPMISARVGYIDSDFVINPSIDQLEEKSELNMLVSFVGPEKKFLAVEAEANILSEDIILGAMNYARDSLDDVYKLIEEFSSEVNPDHTKYEYESQAIPQEVLDALKPLIQEDITKVVTHDFSEGETYKSLHKKMEKLVFAEFEGKFKKATMAAAIERLEELTLQKLILDDNRRPDGRDVEEIRPLTAKAGVLPRAHGTGLFTRGLTQVLSVATLGSPSNELLVQNMYGETNKRYIHYYTFLPFATGETGRVGGAGSREIGHGVLAERALRPVIPSQDSFPYTILVTSETLSSSGSSSMASACGSSLALMDAGVPIKAIVGGIGVGLITNDDFSKYKILTDLAYGEDAHGFLDYKMTGTKEGVTAIQCDMKATGIPMELMPKILDQSKRGRLVVISKIEETLNAPRTEVSKYAPKMLKTQVEEDQIGKVIGSGGKTIKEIQELTNTEVSIDDDGLVTISCIDQADGEKALEIIDGMTRRLEMGEVLEGKVKEILDFGAIVELFPGRAGLLHISELTDSYVENVREFLNEGDTVKVKIIGFGERGKISLSRKALIKDSNSKESAPDRRPSRDR